jgi:hypothetical protein
MQFDEANVVLEPIAARVRTCNRGACECDVIAARRQGNYNAGGGSITAIVAHTVASMPVAS